MLFVLFLLVSGAVLGAKLRFFLFLHPAESIRALFRRSAAESADGYSPLRALTVSLAGTLGVGNITGVAAAMLCGGPGALFWMWASALLTMLLKYTEIVLAVRTRVRTQTDGKTVCHGGPMQYLLLLPHGKQTAYLFCFLCIAASVLQGNFMQTHAAARCIEEGLSVPPPVTAAVMTVCAACLIFGGRQKIAAFSARMIPLMTVLYLLMAGTVLIRQRAELPQTFSLIVREAFSLRAAGSGAGLHCFLAMRHGCAKGVFSHEAGCGTAPISHAGAEHTDPHRQGLLGAAEVAVDTLLLCTVTGLVLLVSEPETLPPDPDGAVIAAFSLWFGDSAAAFLGIAVFFFAFASLVCWSFYGTECTAFCFPGKNRAVFFYLLSFCLLIPAGIWAGEAFLWHCCDLLTVCMTALNTCACLALASRYVVPVAENARKSGRKMKKERKNT